MRRRRKKNPSLGDVGGLLTSLVVPSLAAVLTGAPFSGGRAEAVATGTLLVGGGIASAYAWRDGLGAPGFTRGYAVGSVAWTAIALLSMAFKPSTPPATTNLGQSVKIGDTFSFANATGVSASGTPLGGGGVLVSTGPVQATCTAIDTAGGSLTGTVLAGPHVDSAFVGRQVFVATNLVTSVP